MRTGDVIPTGEDPKTYWKRGALCWLGSGGFHAARGEMDEARRCWANAKADLRAARDEIGWREALERVVIEDAATDEVIYDSAR